jgi:hypothetical protein
MIYINSKGEYPRHIGDVQLEKKGWKEGDVLPIGWKSVVETTRPAPKANYITFEDYPIEVDGVMTQNWQTRKMTAEEIERRDAPANAKSKLEALGFTPAEIQALVAGLVR